MPSTFREATLAILLAFLAPVSAAGKGNSVHVPAETLSRLAGETTEKVLEISRARGLARKYGARLATYGGTSREILDFVLERVESLGSVKAYEDWLRKTPRIHLLDWHRIASDLDLMVIPEAGAAPGPRLEELLQLLSREFPGNGFYAKFDANVADSFFKKFPPASEHLEPISNIPISDRGVEELATLTVPTSKGKVNLAQEGLKQFEQRRFGFFLASGFGPGHPMARDSFANLRQVLRWIRYLSENPGFKPDAASEHAIRSLLKHALDSDRAQVLELLKAGDRELRGTSEAVTPAGKLIQALEKLQLYSKDSVRTHALLNRYGITELCREAGIDASRILTPLPTRASEAAYAAARRANGGTLPRAGESKALLHRSRLAAAQSISGGALWQSDNTAVILGRTTSAIYGNGLYAAEGSGAFAYGDFSVKVWLNPDAVPGVDYVANDGAYILKTQRAIARGADGSLRIERVSMDQIQGHFLSTLEAATKAGTARQISELERRSLVRGLAGVLTPEADSHDERLFWRTRELARKLDLEDEFYQTYGSRSGIVEGLRSNPRFAARLLSTVKKPENYPWDLTNPGQVRLVREFLKKSPPKILPQGAPYGIESWVDKLFARQPELFLKEFPSHLDLLRAPRPGYDPQRVKPLALDGPNSEVLTRIIERIASGKEPAAWEERILSHFMQREPYAIFQPLSHGANPHAVNWTLTRLRTDSGLRRAAGSVLFRFDTSPHHPIRRAIETDEALRAQFLALLREPGIDPRHFHGFPWDFRRPGDAEAIRKLIQAEGLDGTRTSDLIRIALNRLLSDDPILFTRIFPELASNYDLVPLPTIYYHAPEVGEPHESWSIHGYRSTPYQKLQSGGWAALSESDRASILEDLRLPLREKSYRQRMVLEFLISASPESRELAFTRLTDLQPKDARNLAQRIAESSENWRIREQVRRFLAASPGTASCAGQVRESLLRALSP